MKASHSVVHHGIGLVAVWLWPVDLGPIYQTGFSGKVNRLIMIPNIDDWV